MLCLRYLQSPKRWFTHYNIERRKETYMNKKEVLEIRKQFSPKNCAITKICGCYVDYEKNKKMESKDAFLALRRKKHLSILIFLRRHFPEVLERIC